MEQTVWIYFGVITVVLGFGIVGKLLLEHKAQQKDDMFDKALDQLQGRCNFVCKSAAGTRLSQEVELPSGLLMDTETDKICAFYKNQKRCVNCICELRPYMLNLNTTLALKTFETHNYKCFFVRAEDDISMECQG